MKYLSELTNKSYDTVEELELAEKEHQELLDKEEEKKAKRAERAKEVKAAFVKACEEQDKANELLKAFVEDYGSYHTSITEPLSSTSLFDYLVDRFFSL